MKSYVYLQRPMLVAHSNTDIVLGVSLHWTVTVQAVGSIASHIILEDFIVCTTSDTTSTRQRRAKSRQSTHE